MQEVVSLHKYPYKGHMKWYVKSDARFFMEHGMSGAGVEFTLLLLGIASPGLLYQSYYASESHILSLYEQYLGEPN